MSNPPTSLNQNTDPSILPPLNDNMQKTEENKERMVDENDENQIQEKTQSGKSNSSIDKLLSEQIQRKLLVVKGKFEQKWRQNPELKPVKHLIFKVS